VGRCKGEEQKMPIGNKSFKVFPEGC